MQEKKPDEKVSYDKPMEEAKKKMMPPYPQKSYIAVNVNCGGEKLTNFNFTANFEGDTWGIKPYRSDSFPDGPPPPGHAEFEGS